MSIFNAKTKRREDAKKNYLKIFAPLRLCVFALKFFG